MTKRTKGIPKSNWGWMSICLLLILSACTADMKIQDEQNDDRYLNLSFQKTKTKTDLNSDGSGNFSEGDKIGLFIDNGSEIQYREQTYSGGKWGPMLRRSDFGTGNLIISAHYPAISDGASTEYNLQINTDQSQSGENKSDILFAKDTIAEGEYDAYFPFEHIMHRLKIETSGNTENVSILVRSKSNGNINLQTGEIQVNSNDFQFITPKKNNDGSLEAIIFPQPVSPYRTEEGLLKITKDGKDSYYKAPEKLDNGITLTEFEKGKETTIKLVFKEDETSEWANKTVWVYGIKEPDPNDWKQVYPTTNITYYLLWKKEYGWFDVNKINPTDIEGGIQDAYMCWAASASNLLHWWITMNKEYIDRYIESGKYKGPDYTYNSENAFTDNKQESQIFQDFLNSFENEAGNIDDGTNWFIHGKLPTLPPMTYPINNAGYFKDVFPEGVRLGKNIAGIGKETFNKTIKDALLNNKAIGFNAGNVKSSHAMTIWGAEFDENGDISYIYYVDNNDRSDVRYFGCIRVKIVYPKMPEGGNTTGYKYGYIGEPEDSYKPINRLFTLELGTEYWKKYFNE